MRSLPFSFARKALYRFLPVSTGYGDKLLRIIDAADPGAVPGGSTITNREAALAKDPGPVIAGVLTGPNQDRRVLKSVIFARAE